MKKALLFAVLGIALIACNNHKKELEGMQIKNDSLTAVNVEQGEAVMEFVASFNDIQETLDSIKQLEKMISVSTNQPGAENNVSAKDQIEQDIIAIHSMLRRNKEMVATLRARLKKSEGKTAELGKMISFLGNQIEAKDAEIAKLRDELASMNIKVENLSTQVKDLSSENENKNREIENKTNELNAAYYALGSKRELIDNKVITREGGVLGIGKSSTLAKDFNQDYFTKVDIRKLKYIPLNVKKAKIITSHPSDSYRISGAKTADTLFITDPNRFWTSSKHLVIMID